MFRRSGSIGTSMRRTTALSKSPTSRSRESKPKSSSLTYSPRPSPSPPNGREWWPMSASVLSGCHLRVLGLAEHDVAPVSPRNHLVHYPNGGSGGHNGRCQCKYVFIYIAFLHDRWVLNRLCFSVPANICSYIYIYIYMRFGDDQGPSLRRHKIFTWGEHGGRTRCVDKLSCSHAPWSLPEWGNTAKGGHCGCG